MIQINKVKSLRKKWEPMTYGELKQNDCFIWVEFPDRLARKTSTGYLQEDSGHHYVVGLTKVEDAHVILCDAEINWCPREEE